VLFVPEQLRFTRRPGQTLAAVSLILAILPSCRADQGARGTGASSGAGAQAVAEGTSPGEFYFPEMLTGGVGLLDADGDLDAYLTQGQMLGENGTAGGATATLPRSEAGPR
jgi:hypothetical protein